MDALTQEERAEINGLIAKGYGRTFDDVCAYLIRSALADLHLCAGYYPLHRSDATPVPGDVLPAPQLVGNVQMWRDKNGQLWRRKRTGPGEWEPWECENTQSTK